MIDSIYAEFKERFSSLQKKKKRSAIAQLLMWGLTGLFFVSVLVNFIRHMWVPGGAVADPTDPFARGVDFLGYRWTPEMLFIVVVMLVGVGGYAFGILFNKFKKEEELTIAALLKKLFPSFHYMPVHYLPRQEMLRSKIFASYKPEEARSAYHMYGYMKSRQLDQEFHVADIGLREDDASNKFQKILLAIPYLNMLVMMYEFVGKNLFSAKTADNIYYSFRGLFCWTDFHKPLKGHTVVLPDMLESKLGEFSKSIQALNFKRDELVTLEDPRFQKEFVVYSTDQIEARYVLSTAFMEKLLELRQKFDRPLMASFCHDKVYIAVQEPNGIFSFNPATMGSAKAIEDIQELINLSQDVVKDLGLKRPAMMPSK